MCSSESPLFFMVSNPAHNNTGRGQIHQTTVIVLDRLTGNSLLFVVLTFCKSIPVKSPVIIAFGTDVQACYKTAPDFLG